MNFLLHMLGRTAASPAGLRPTPRQSLLAQAARAAAQGNVLCALQCYRTLCDHRPSPLDVLIRGHLHLVSSQPMEAALHFAEGLTRLHQTRAADHATPTVLERLLSHADQQSAAGNYAQSIATLRRARALLEIVIAAEAGLMLAVPQSDSARALASLAHLSDLTLRLMARIELATHMSTLLGPRHITAQNAIHAVSPAHVQELLTTQQSQLARAASLMPNHLENQHRLALISRALGHHQRSDAALTHILTLHPHHVASAARLTNAAARDAALKTAFDVPPATLALFAQFATASAQPATLDSFAGDSAHRDPHLLTTRANLAFALAELSMLDETHAPWREILPV